MTGGDGGVLHAMVTFGVVVELMVACVAWMMLDACAQLQKKGAGAFQRGEVRIVRRGATLNLLWQLQTHQETRC